MPYETDEQLADRAKAMVDEARERNNRWLVDHPEQPVVVTEQDYLAAQAELVRVMQRQQTLRRDAW